MSVFTIFPPIPQTVWSVHDSAVERLLGEPSESGCHVQGGTKGLITRGPKLVLEQGLYGVEVQLAPSEVIAEPETHIAFAQIVEGQDVLAESNVTAGQIAQRFEGMYGGARLNLIVDRPLQNADLRLYSLGAATFSIIGFKLIPRPGQVWFVHDLAHVAELWTHHADRSATCSEPTMVGGPGIDLRPGDYRVGIKLLPPGGMTSGEFAVISVEAANGTIIVPETAVSAEDALANFGIPDSKMRFRLQENQLGVELRVRTLMPDVTLQWVRLATDDEATWHHYYNMGGSSSRLGRPISRFLHSEISPQGRIGAVRNFERGAIYWTVEAGPCEVIGETYREYLEQGGPSGLLGYPITRPKVSSDSMLTQGFEGGELKQTLDSEQHPQ